MDVLILTNMQFFKSSSANVNRSNVVRCFMIFAIFLIISGCKSINSVTDSEVSQTTILVSKNQLQSDEWKLMTAEETKQIWKYILHSPLGIAALNQLAIEGFISPTCPKTFYTNQKYGGFKTLLQVKCKNNRGISIAVSYDEMHVIFDRFEDSIEGFQVKRIHASEE